MSEVQRDLAVRAGEVTGKLFPTPGGEGPARPASRVRARRPLGPAKRLAGMAASSSPAIQAPAEALPIWFSALTAAHCQAHTKCVDRAVLWNCVAGRALYTNEGTEMETIEPLGVRLQGGHTLAVSWQPGESAYRVEVLRPLDYVA